MFQIYFRSFIKQDASSAVKPSLVLRGTRFAQLTKIITDAHCCYVLEGCKTYQMMPPQRSEKIT